MPIIENIAGIQYARTLDNLSEKYNVRLSPEALDITARFDIIEEICNHHLDTTPPLLGKRRVAEAALSFLRDNSDVQSSALFPYDVRESLEDISRMALRLPENRRPVLFEDLEILLNTSIKIHESSSVRKVIALTKIEANQAVQVLLDLFPDKDIQQPGFTKFSRSLKRLRRADNLCDTADDFWEDVKNGKLSCRPSHINRFLFKLTGYMQLVGV